MPSAISTPRAARQGRCPKKVRSSRTPEIEKNYQDQKETAIKCIEAFFDAQWKEMAKNTQAKKAKAAANSAADQKKAQAKIDELDKTKPRTEEQDKQLAQARIDLQKAKDAPAEYDKVKDLDPNDVDKCMGESKPPARTRSRNTKVDSTDPATVETNEEE